MNDAEEPSLRPCGRRSLAVLPERSGYSFLPSLLSSRLLSPLSSFQPILLLSDDRNAIKPKDQSWHFDSKIGSSVTDAAKKEPDRFSDTLHLQQVCTTVV